MRIAIVGGTGAFGRALAGRWYRLDLDVTIGSRDARRAEQQAAVIGVKGAVNADAVRDADFVVLELHGTCDELRQVIAFAHLGQPGERDDTQLCHSKPVSRRPATTL